MSSWASDAPTQAGSVGSGASTIDARPDATGPRDESRTPTFVPGQIVGDCFRIEQVLGAGGMGVVYKATHLSLDRVVALKVHRGGASACERLEAEARAMARLAHPNVVGVYDVRSSPEGLFIAMEFVDGTHARTWLAARKRSLAERLQMCMQAGEGLSAAHAVGLVHRDFKPENVLVSRTGRVAVADFGLAMGTGGNPGEIVGTPAYMAREQFDGATIDARADQFAFCVLLHEALYGVRPFPGRTPAQLAFEVANGQTIAAPPRTDVPAELREVILRGLRPDPAQRHATIGALLTEVRAVMKAPAKRAVGFAVALTLVLAAVLVLAVFFVYRYIADARARAVAMPQLQGLHLGADASRASLEISAELIAQQRVLVAEAERKARVADALQDVAEGNVFDDPEGFAAAIAQAGDDEAPVGDLVIGILKGVDNSQQERDTGEYHRAAWDGKSTLVCGMNQSMEVRGVTARIAEGPAIQAEMNCRIRLVDCDIEADTIVAGDMARIIYIEGGRYVAKDHLIHTDMAKEVTVVNVRMDKATKEAAVAVGMRATVRITGSTLRGATALAVGMHTKAAVEDSTLVGRDHAIEAEMHAHVALRDATVEGSIERGQNAIVEIVDE